MNKKSIGSLAIMMAVCATSAHAVIIDFEDLGVAPGTQLNPASGVSVTSRGFSYTPGPNNASGFNDLHISSEGFWSYNGTTVGGTHDDVILRKATGAPFSLQAFDFAGFPINSETSFSVVGNLVGGGVVSANFTPDGITDGIGGAVDFQKFTLGAGWTNLDHVTWTHSGAGTNSGLFALDNIVVNQIPEPGTLALLAVALIVGCGVNERCRRSYRTL
jgi:hypothetical protein